MILTGQRKPHQHILNKDVRVHSANLAYSKWANWQLDQDPKWPSATGHGNMHEPPRCSLGFTIPRTSSWQQ